ncbi:MAG: hypothetical protein EOS34_29955 [Mesorhizobium sp.]|nr:MAG: hypothetical protein EOS34_29955 [Mesorhizobium sp.]
MRGSFFHGLPLTVVTICVGGARKLAFNANEAAFTLVSMLDAFWLSMSLSTDNVTPSSAISMCRKYLDMLVDGAKGSSAATSRGGA